MVEPDLLEMKDGKRNNALHILLHLTICRGGQIAPT
jgi:hypothetical protein